MIFIDHRSFCFGFVFYSFGFSFFLPPLEQGFKHIKPQTAAFVFDSPRPVRQALKFPFSFPKKRKEEKDGRALKHQVGSPARRPLLSRLEEKRERVGDPAARPRQNSDVGGVLHHRLSRGRKKRERRGGKRGSGEQKIEKERSVEREVVFSNDGVCNQLFPTPGRAERFRNSLTVVDHCAEGI